VPRRILGIVDSDSFVKWGASLLGDLPLDWDAELVAISTTATASPAQLAGALSGGRFSDKTVAQLTLNEIVRRVQIDPVDAVLVAVRGPVGEVLLGELSTKVRPRPVLVTGLPGISIPSKWKGLFLRAQADLFVLHSRREVREYRALASLHGLDQRFALATLPFLDAAVATPRAEHPDSIVFAAQPSVPRLQEDRERIVGWLADTARAHPDLRVVIKIRARTGEQQTHAEKFPYAELVPADAPPNLVVEGGSMANHLARAVGLVTVSSTAIVEAIALDVPSIVLSDFGIGAKLINEVFIGSGLLASSDDLIAGRFRHVLDGWRDDNYFHPRADDSWVDELNSLADAREAAVLAARPSFRSSRGGALRKAYERKLAFGPFDRTASGTLAMMVGVPARSLRSRLKIRGRALTPALRLAERAEA
jgi:hypothetical protein